MRQDFKSFFSRAKLPSRAQGQTGRRACQADCRFHGGAEPERAGREREADWLWAAVDEPWAVGLAALSLRGAWGETGGLWVVDGRGWIGRGGRIGRIGGGGGAGSGCSWKAAGGGGSAPSRSTASVVPPASSERVHLYPRHGIPDGGKIVCVEVPAELPWVAVGGMVKGMVHGV